MKQLVKGAVIITAIVISMNLSEKSCLAAASNADNIALNQIQVTSNGGKIESKEMETALELLFSTKGEKTGYYTVNLASSQVVNLQNKEVIQIDIQTRDQVSMNLNMMTKEYKAVQCKDGTSVYVKSDRSKSYEIKSVKNGTFTMDADFSGTIYIPITTLGSKTKAADVKHFGLMITKPEETQAQVTISKVRLLSKKDLPSESLKYSYEILGNTTPLIPSVGEHEYEYQVVKTSDEKERIPYTFSLTHKMQGVNVSKNGRIVFDEGCEQKEVMITVAIGDTFTCLYKIMPEYSPFVESGDPIAVNYVVPQVGEVAEYHIKTPRSLDNGVRILLLVASFLYLAFYDKMVRKG